MKRLHARELSRNQLILRFDVILQHDWPIEQCLLHIRVFFGGKTKSPCFDLSVHWLIKQITNTYRNHFSRSYQNRSIFHMPCVLRLKFHFSLAHKVSEKPECLFHVVFGKKNLIAVFKAHVETKDQSTSFPFA